MSSVRDAKRFLKGFKKASVEYDSLNDEYQRHMTKLYSSPLASNYSGGGGGSGCASDRMGDDVAEYVDFCRRLSDELKAYIGIRDDVRGVIRRVMEVNEKWGLSLHYRYIDWMHPTAVAYEMDYSDPGVERKNHAAAVKFVADMYPNTIERDLAILDSMCKRDD